MEYRLVYHMVARKDSDFYSGVDVVLISKSGAPNWKHAAVEGVPEEEVLAFFETNPPQEELQLSERTGAPPAPRL